MDNVKKDSKRKIIIIIGIAVILAALAVVVFSMRRHASQTAYVDKLISQRIEAASNSDAQAEPEHDIDFAKLQAINPDIYAWIEVPGTSVSYPVLQHPTDDSFYLTHGFDKEESYGGAVFSQAIYNGTDFSDSCTVLYGHRMRDGSMFADLSNYMDRNYFDEHSRFYIYTPDQTLEYEVFAAIPFDNRNILYTWDCSQKLQFWSLVQTILDTRTVDANIKEDYKMDFYNKIVILSTCYPGDNTNRYLVIGNLITE